MKLIRKNGMLGIDKTEIDELIATKEFVGLNRSPRAEKVIVSLTSYKPRINDVKYAIYSLLNQTFPPDKLILWLDEDSFPQREENLPQDLLELRNFGLTIDWSENLRPYTKLIPALEKYPDDIIVTADDDIFYRADWLKILYDEHLNSPDCVIAHRAHGIRLDAQGNIFPYTAWHSEIKTLITPPRHYKNFLTGVGGVLYKKKFFHGDILKREIFMEVSPTNDDIWFWAMAVLNDTPIKIPAAAQSNLIYVDIDAQLGEETLSSKNVGHGRNDIQLKQVIEHYPALLEKLIRESTEFKPYISIVMPIKNSANVAACLKNIFGLNFPDFELIIINLGSQFKLPTLPTNFRVINCPGGTVNDALNLGLQKSTGEYVLFKDETSTLPRDALEVVAQIADSSKADVIHFAGRVQLNGKLILDDKIQYNNQPTFLDASRQRRAVMWLQNILSKRLDTKIFRRDFLTEHKLTFGNDLSEFMFRALIQAEKYLLLPRAFGFYKE